MKIAFVSDGDNMIASHFGMSKGFEIFDVEDGQVIAQNFIENPFSGNAQGMHQQERRHGQEHAAQRHAGILEALKDCKVVISHGMGKGAYRHLKEAGKEVFVTRETEIDKALELYIQGKLVDMPRQGFEP
ncbi:MAG: NifB/NifX family molybdenum-iron cluster-binding protein [Bacteroidota bacterium]|nr:NifB/NifX family molybdenum-iron cluster-binding protein [Bacteroidota bacterium]